MKRQGLFSMTSMLNDNTGNFAPPITPRYKTKKSLHFFNSASSATPAPSYQFNLAERISNVISYHVNQVIIDNFATIDNYEVFLLQSDIVSSQAPSFTNTTPSMLLCSIPNDKSKTVVVRDNNSEAKVDLLQPMDILQLTFRLTDKNNNDITTTTAGWSFSLVIEFEQQWE
jgi:hypothetical protein